MSGRQHDPPGDDPAGDDPAAQDPAADEHRRVARIYARYASSPAKRHSWSAENPGNAAIRAELTGAVFELAGPELRAAATILDIGCGSGWWLEHLAVDARISARLHGVELLPERAVAASARAPAAAISIADARSLPHDSRSFDVVTMFTTLSSLSGTEDAVRSLQEARRVLRPGGALLVWEPRLPNPLNRATVFIGDDLLRAALAGGSVQTRTTTVLPALARRLGSHTGRWYPRLARISALRTHRLVCSRVTPPLS